MQPSEDISVLVRVLAGYMRANPKACDTCEGVRDWWLGSRGGGATLRDVQEALDTLVDYGVVVRVVALDGKVRYRCASDDAATLARLEQLAQLDGNETT